MKSTKLFLIALLSLLLACNDISKDGKQTGTINKHDSFKNDRVENKQTKGEEKVYDTLDIKDIIINNKYTPYSIGSNISILLKKADSIIHDSSGFGDCYQTTFYFKKSTISLCDSTLFHFELLDNSLFVSIKSIKITVGENDDILKQMFPKSYSIKDTMGNQGIYHGMTCIRIYCDEMNYLLFMVNKSGRITDILFWEDNS